MNDLTQALREVIAATAEINPADLEPGDLQLWHAADQKCWDIIEALISLHREAEAEAREILQRFMLPR